MAQDLTGKTILVTGASRGVGAAVARACAQSGARVLIHFAQEADAASRLALELRVPDADILQADLVEAGAGAELWRVAVERAGRIDGLVNNAGVFTPTDLDGSDADWAAGWRRTLQINLIAAADLCREAVRHYRDHGGGKIINIASRAAHRGDTPDYLPYAASKGGLVALTKSLARGYAKHGVIAVAISPGFVETDMAKGFIDAHGRAAAAGDIPLGDLAQPEEIGALAVFLLGDVTRSITGATIDVNGASYLR
ncbi:MAG: SDR family NAD(P)-dependent oxidoreductase [Maricaulaceae bacterium]